MLPDVFRRWARDPYDTAPDGQGTEAPKWRAPNGASIAPVKAQAFDVAGALVAHDELFVGGQ